jgi:hypothetical protein
MRFDYNVEPIDLTREPLIEDFVGVSEIEPWNFNALRSLVQERRESKEILTIGVFACMPKLIYYNNNGSVGIRFGDVNERTPLEFQSNWLENYLMVFPDEFGIDTSVSCIVADLEPVAKLGPQIDLGPEYQVLREKVKQKFIKRFPLVQFESDLIGWEYTQQYQSVKAELLFDWRKKIGDIRVTSRVETITSIGIPYQIAEEIAISEVAGMDAIYALEGLWIAQERPFDLLAIADNYPISSAERTIRLVGSDKFSIIFPADYDRT